MFTPVTFQMAQTSNPQLTDNVSTMLQMTNLGLKKIPCIAYLSNLIVSNSLKAIKRTIIWIEENCPSENPYMTTQEIKGSDMQNLDYSTRQKILENIDQFSIFSQALEKCSSIASYFNHSTMMKEELMKKKVKEVKNSFQLSNK